MVPRAAAAILRASNSCTEFENSDVDTHQDEQEGFQNNNTPARNEEESGIPTRQGNPISFSIVFHC
jgi:hypothetical protein